ncbi:MAG: oligogalacturonate lyase family protein [Ferruginibacter sp.]
MCINKNLPTMAALLLTTVGLHAQPVLKTGAKMPDEWIDADTHHKIIKLTRRSGSNMSFYFHNNPFVGSKMVFYGSGRQNSADISKQETYNNNGRNKQLYTVDLNTLAIEQLTHQRNPMKGEIVSAKRKEVFYQVADTIFATSLETKKERRIFVFPKDFRGDITSINADGTLLGGTKSEEAEKDIFKANPEKKDYFNKIYEAKLKRTLFTVNIETKKLDPIFSDTAWLNHVQFSSTDPNLLMFCHEGPWHKVDRIWTIDVKSKKVTKVHERTMDMEIAGHEWFSKDGQTIWFDLQQPRGATFFVGGYNVNSGKEMKYELQRNEWSVHYTSNNDNSLFAGDGGDTSAVAKAKDGKWIYLFTPKGDHFVAEKLVNMIAHRYKLEPNVHFSPDQQWIIFRANFEGDENVYAVEIKKS